MASTRHGKNTIQTAQQFVGLIQFSDHWRNFRGTKESRPPLLEWRYNTFYGSQMQKFAFTKLPLFRQLCPGPIVDL